MIAEVIVDIALSETDKIFDYIMPDDVKVGERVLVHFGKNTLEGFVIGVKDKTDYPDKIKEIIKPLDDFVAVTPEMIALMRNFSKSLNLRYIDLLRLFLPAGLRGGVIKPVHVEYAKLSGDADTFLDTISSRAKQQRACVEYLKENSDVKKAYLTKTFGNSAVNSLINCGYIEVYSVEKLRTPEVLSTSKKSRPTLNPDQQKAVDEITKGTGTFLLHGVTGSGKTEVYMHCIEDALSKNKTAIMLVPEISLTPQVFLQFKERFGDKVAILHSGLSQGERFDEWRRLRSGEATVAVGARSAIFAPLENLRLIIVDEEHDTAYKQDKSPRYNGRDVAVMRAKLAGCACILGSATPALETLHNVKTGKYALSKIAHRIDGSKMPSVFIVDMKREKPGIGISNILKEKLARRLDEGEQAILFLNRRGYSKIFECPDCGEVEKCPHCSVSMTWHKKEDIIKCHLCGYTAKAPRACRKCGSPKAKWRGAGTQKIEEAISAMFPAARIGRMDRDAMKRRDNYRKILGDFRRGKLDILVGTQMIAKGLDFPRVTLVGIIDADISLHMPDFRAAEKTYQLIVQVAGRAGRGEARGEVVVQTMTPESAPIQYAKRDDMESFLEEELANRVEYGYPPSTRLIRHIFRSRSEEKLEFYAEKWANEIEKKIGDFCSIRGPAPAPLEKSEDFYRWHIWYFTQNVRMAVAEITKLRAEFPMDEDVEDTLDVDPMSMM